jgi:hypothetical protein
MLRDDTRKILLKVCLASLAVATAQGQITPIPFPAQIPTVRLPSATPRSALVRLGDLVFPHLANGGGWETGVVLVNMTSASIKFDQFFLDQSGNPMPVTLRTIPQGEIITTSALSGVVPANGTLNFLLYDAGQPLNVGWSFINYDFVNTRLGGYAFFRQRTGVGAFEALVPLGSIDDYKFYLAFDNLANFVTTLALVNFDPATTNTITATFRDTGGTTLAVRTIRIGVFGQVAFILPNEVPETRNRAGTVYIEGSGMFMTGLGFRFHPQGAFATIPIMNWTGMFPPSRPN